MGASGVLIPHQPHHGSISLSFVHHHLSSTPPPPPLASSSPPTSPGDPITSPSPLLRDVGSLNIAPAPSQARMLPQPPLPFLKGCGRLSLARWRIRGGKKTKEWEAPLVSYKIRAMTFVVVRFRDPSPYPPTDASTLSLGRIDTPNRCLWGATRRQREEETMTMRKGKGTRVEGKGR